MCKINKIILILYHFFSGIGSGYVKSAGLTELGNLTLYSTSCSDIAVNVDPRPSSGIGYLALVLSTKLPYAALYLVVLFAIVFRISFSSNIIVYSSPSCVPSVEK